MFNGILPFHTTNNTYTNGLLINFLVYVIIVISKSNSNILVVCFGEVYNASPAACYHLPKPLCTPYRPPTTMYYLMHPAPSPDHPHHLPYSLLPPPLSPPPYTMHHLPKNFNLHFRHFDYVTCHILECTLFYLFLSFILFSLYLLLYHICLLL